jgi:hypothetical protein
MTTQQLEHSLTIALKAYIKKEGYVATGSLLKSIGFKATYKNLKLDIKLVANDYIQYLDDGDLVDKFLSTKKAQEYIAEFYVDAMLDNITDEL